MSLAAFLDRGWSSFAPEAAVREWLAHAKPRALAALGDPELGHWWRSGGTWFVGVKALGNDAEGRVRGRSAQTKDASPPLAGAAIDFIRDDLGFGDCGLDRAQVSAVLPGYPRIGRDETEAAFRYRLTRDAAHLDGLHAIGPERRRMQREFPAFLMGLPVTRADPAASPLAVWEGSHHIMAGMYRRAFRSLPAEEWPLADLTEAYHEARREAFARCRRVTLNVAPGGAYVLHRFALHGIAPWRDGASAAPEGRVILYFRAETSPLRWLDQA